MELKLPDIAAEIAASYRRDIKQIPCHSNWASKLGHPCLRHLVHWRLDWDKVPLSDDVVRQYIFNGGRVIEQYIAKVYLERAGYDIVENNKSIAWREKEIGANLDFSIRKKGVLDKEIPVEAKTMAHYDWVKITAIEDFLESKKLWTRGYPAQLTVYMLQKNIDVGMFLLISKQTFEPKAIWVNLDYTYAENLIRKAETINEYVRKKEYPDRLEYASNICDKCEFGHICLPDITNKGAELLDSDEWHGKLTRWCELKPFTSEFHELDDEVKEAFRDRDVVIGTDFRVTGTYRNFAKYDIPKEVKEQYKLMEPVWIKKVIDLRKGEKTIA